MAQAGKLSSRRSRPSYVMAIVGVTLVLVLLGFLGWIGINYSKLSDYFKESVPVQIFLRETATDKDKDAVVAQLKSLPQIKSYTYKDKEAARKEWISMGNEDFAPFVDSFILPKSIDVSLKSKYVVSDTLKALKIFLEKNPVIYEVKYPTNVVGNMGILRKIGMGLLIVALILCIAVVFLIDNTIRLAMFSNRFLIKTMQMVGATRWFIAKPMDIRAIINGSISSVIAIVLCWFMLSFFEKQVPELQTLHDNTMLFMLFGLMLILGVFISLVSTHRSVIKYLKMKLDELY